MSIWYDGGTLAVESGSASVVGTETLFMTRTKVADMLVTFQGGTLRLNQVVSRSDDNNLTISPPWAGTTASGLTYYIVPTSPDWGVVSSVASELSTFLANRASFFPTDGKPSNDLGGNGSFAIDPNATPFPLLYSKSAGAWDDGTSLSGPTGATGKGYGGTSTDSKTLANSGSMSFTTQSGLAWLAGSRIRIASAAAVTTKWMEGVISSYSGTTLVVTIDKQGPGSGSASDWTFSSAGIPGEKGDAGATGSTGSTGATGATGLGYGGTSTTSRAIGSSGTMTWTIGTGKAYQVGDLVKVVVSTDTTQWMKGVVSGYAAGVLSVDINEKSPAGSGTYASWNIGLVGETGQQGIQGIQGDPGSNGADGSILTATSSTSVTSATGDQTFTLDDDANFLVNQRVRAASSTNSDNWMSGLVKSWNSGTKALVVTIDLIGADPDTATDWTISVTGEKGDQGPAGGFGSLDATKGNIIIADGTTFGVESFGADGNLIQADSSQPHGIASRSVGAALSFGSRPTTTIASAATCDIGAATTDYVIISGTTTITSFGTSSDKIRKVRFSGALTLTYNGTSLILPGLTNITTAAGDEAEFASDGSGNWKCRTYLPAVGYSKKGSNVVSIKRQTFTNSGTYTPSPGMLYADVRMTGGGGSGGGCASSAATSNFGAAAGGSAGEYAEGTFSAATIGASQTVTIGAGGAAPAAGNNSGNAGGTTSLGTLLTAVGGAGGAGSPTSNASSGVAGTAGGTGGTGTGLHSPGGASSAGFWIGASNLAWAGNGGTSLFGGGGSGGVGTVFGIPSPIAGTAYGSGGGGAANGNSAAAKAGAAGASGVVIITEYCSQ